MIVKALLPKLGSLWESLRRPGTVATASLKILVQSVRCQCGETFVIPKLSAHVPFMKLIVDAVQEWWKTLIQMEILHFFDLCYALMPGLYQLDLSLSKSGVQNYLPPLPVLLAGKKRLLLQEPWVNTICFFKTSFKTVVLLQSSWWVYIEDRITQNKSDGLLKVWFLLFFLRLGQVLSCLP